MEKMASNNGESDEYLNEPTHWSTPTIQRVNKQNNTLPIWRSSETMNLNHLVLENIRLSPYFKNKLSTLKTCLEVIDEIYYSVSHLEPWERGTHKTAGQTGMCGGVRGVGAGGVVSTPFCILYKLFTLKLTRKQLVGMINHTDSPYIRALGFMYVRFCQPPETFWEWYEPYFDDEEEIDPKAGGGDTMQMGQLVKLFLTKLDWYGTLFPRIPVPVQKDIDQKLRDYNMHKFEEAKKANDYQEEEQQMPEPEPPRKETRRSPRRSPPPRRYDGRGRERSVERMGPPKRSRSRSKRRSRSPSKHSRSDRRHSRNRSKSPGSSKRTDMDRHSSRKDARSRSKSPRESKRRHRSGSKHGHKKHKHRHHRHRHRSHRSRHDRKKSRSKERKNERSKSQSGTPSKSPEPEKSDYEKELPQRMSPRPDSNDGTRSKSSDKEDGELEKEQVREEGELIDDVSNGAEDRR